TLSIVFEDKKYSEEEYQKIIIDKTGANHQSYLVTEEEFNSSIPDILLAMDQPSTDGINSYFICKYAKAFGLKAVLSGLGADELFGGYDSFYRTSKVKYLNLLPSIVLSGAEAFGNDKIKKLAFLKSNNFLGDYLLNRGFYSSSQTAEILGCSREEVDHAIASIDLPQVANIKSAIDKVSAGEQHLYMQNQLLKDTDYMSMWHGVEVRVPFLDKDLMQAVHSISSAVKYDPSLKKSLLIKAFKDVLPKEIYERKKQGFTFPFATWLKTVSLSMEGLKAKSLQKKFFADRLNWSRYWALCLLQKAMYKPR
ncbi:MAG TPA: asparagine synthase C-terminal domain-containing protein, partial [Segetibacter sp.]